MLEIKDKQFYMDGKPFKIYSGAMHYFRIPREYWEDRLLKLKAAGLNTVETYVAWNIHEPYEGEFCFDGMADIAEYIATAKKLGLYVIVRPGPYICAEWDLGGLPAWLLKDENLRFRCMDKKYVSAVDKYFGVLLPKLVPYLESNGGNIIAMQVENEYGSFGRDRAYLNHVRDLMRSLGIDCMLFTSDGETKYFFSGGGLADEFMVANFGGWNCHRFDDLRELQPDKPLMCGEHWCGWFDQWGKPHHSDDAEASLGKSLDGFFSDDANFNLYMFHGGTNFGFTSGANYYEKYWPTVTSYDYGAPLSECGGYTEKYFILRERMKKKLGTALPELPADTELQNIGTVKLTEFADMRKNLSKMGVKKKSHLPNYMEHFGQTQGFIHYHTVIEGYYDDTELNAFGVHDIALVYINGEFAGKYDRTRLKGKRLYEESFSFPIKAFRGKCTVDIFVQALGRVNYSHKIYDRKGLKDIFIGGQLITDWTVTLCEMKTPPEVAYKKEFGEYPCFMRGTFKADEKKDCFVDMSGFKNAAVYVNGFNLGRVLGRGPQKSLYLPGVYLKDENEIVVFELEGAASKKVRITDKPEYK